MSFELFLRCCERVEHAAIILGAVMALKMSEKEAREFFAKIKQPYPLDRAAVAGHAAVKAALAQGRAVDHVQLAAVAAVAQALGVPPSDIYGGL